jgi:hypothetical protein
MANENNKTGAGQGAASEPSKAQPAITTTPATPPASAPSTPDPKATATPLLTIKANQDIPKKGVFLGNEMNHNGSSNKPND